MLPYILSYINIILFGSFFQFFAMVGNGILRGEGNILTPMRVMMAGTLANILTALLSYAWSARTLKQLEG